MYPDPQATALLRRLLNDVGPFLFGRVVQANVAFPADMTGALIGKEFVNLIGIMRQSQTLIEIPRDSVVPGTAVVYAESQQQIEAASRLIQAATSRNLPPDVQAQRNYAQACASARDERFAMADEAERLGDTHLAAKLRGSTRELTLAIELANAKATQDIVDREIAKGCLKSFEFDLHGLHAADAAHVAVMFANTVEPNDCVVITGRGLHSQGHATVRPAVIAALQAMPQRPFIDSSDVGAVAVKWRRR